MRCNDLSKPTLLCGATQLRRKCATSPREDLQRTRIAFALALVMTATVAIGCGDDPVVPDAVGDTVALPLSGAAGGPVVVDVGLEVQSGGIVAVATASDPQGSGNLIDVLQTIGVFSSANCSGAPITIQDDLVGSNIEETFGTVVNASTSRPLYDAIAAAGHLSGASRVSGAFFSCALLL